MEIGTIVTDRPPKRDIYQRERLFGEASFTHHAKMNLNLLQAVLDRYTDPGDVVLDPMGGTGSVLVGLLTGRPVATGDVELQWARLLRDNWVRLCRRSILAFGTPGLVAQWDAVRLPLADGRVDFCITSPPYFDTWSNWDASSNILEERHNEHGLSYGDHPRQIANIHVYEDYLRAMRQAYAELWPGPRVFRWLNATTCRRGGPGFATSTAPGLARPVPSWNRFWFSRSVRRAERNGVWRCWNCPCPTMDQAGRSLPKRFITPAGGVFRFGPGHQAKTSSARRQAKIRLGRKGVMSAGAGSRRGPGKTSRFRWPPTWWPKSV
jgi:hypothetical protein